MYTKAIVIEPASQSLRSTPKPIAGTVASLTARDGEVPQDQTIKPLFVALYLHLKGVRPVEGLQIAELPTGTGKLQPCRCGICTDPLEGRTPGGRKVRSKEYEIQRFGNRVRLSRRLIHMGASGYRAHDLDGNPRPFRGGPILDQFASISDEQINALEEMGLRAYSPIQ